MTDKSQNQQRRITPSERRRRSLFALGAIFTLGGAFLVSAAESIARAFFLPIALVLSTAIALLAAGAGALLQLYLRGDLNLTPLDREHLEQQESSLPDIMADLARVTSRLESIDRRNDKLESILIPLADANTRASRIELPDDLRQELRSLLRQELVREATAEALEALSARTVSDRVRESGLLQLTTTLSESARRLTKELESLDRRGRLNLIIGVLTTAAAVGVLLYLVVGAAAVPHGLYELLSYYIPRLSIAIFIEVFAFFFLRLYKATLLEGKFYQNELTNINLLSFALHSSLLSEQKEALARIAETAAQSDRNRPGSDRASEEQSAARLGDATKLLEAVGSLLKK